MLDHGSGSVGTRFIREKEDTMSAETTRFDQLTRALGRPASRRSALSALLGSAAVPLLASGASAKRSKGKRKAQRPRATLCDVCEKDCPFSSLQPAINAANPGDTIRICEGTYKSNPTVSINTSLTLIGAGADETELKGGGFVRVLNIGPQAVVTLQDLAVTGGVERQQQRLGGAGIMIWDGGTLTLERCRVEDNYARDGGGIAVSRGATLTLLDSVVTQNTAMAGGGGLLVKEGGTATLGAGSRVTDNVSTVFGGGVDLAGTITLKAGSRVDRNKSVFNGGGIFAARGSTAILEAGSHVTDNTAGGGVDTGGGIFNAGATVTIADTSIVTDNDPDNCSGISGVRTPNCINDD